MKMMENEEWTDSRHFEIFKWREDKEASVCTAPAAKIDFARPLLAGIISKFGSM